MHQIYSFNWYIFKVKITQNEKQVEVRNYKKIILF
jgi:hypothetical protein